jgi:hypothetical protein
MPYIEDRITLYRPASHQPPYADQLLLGSSHPDSHTDEQRKNLIIPIAPIPHEYLTRETFYRGAPGGKRPPNRSWSLHPDVLYTSHSADQAIDELLHHNLDFSSMVLHLGRKPMTTHGVVDPGGVERTAGGTLEIKEVPEIIPFAYDMIYAKRYPIMGTELEFVRTFTLINFDDVELEDIYDGLVNEFEERDSMRAGKRRGETWQEWGERMSE